MKKKLCINLLILTALVCFATALTGYVRRAAEIANLLVEEDTMELLRQQEVPAEKYESFGDYGEDSEYSRLSYLLGYLLTGEAGARELEYVPVPRPRQGSSLAVSYDNSWMSERSFGGKRGHEGTDLMASLNERGRYPVVSMTDGVVEKVGWLKLGGYRIGIRSPSGGYFYYAHLYDYAREFQDGEEVKAGELLGFMGDSGYGEQEGTIGQFAVHLHVGIYVEGNQGEEVSVNPYWVLKWLEKRRLRYGYG